MASSDLPGPRLRQRQTMIRQRQTMIVPSSTTSPCMSRSQLLLAKAIEKRPCLYNNGYAFYFALGMRQKAWEEVAAETDLSVIDCKQRWKNIRSFVRKRMRLEASKSNIKTRKSYYLKKHLKFILPFIKPVSSSENHSSSDSDENDSYDAILDTKELIIKTEKEDDEYFQMPIAASEEDKEHTNVSPGEDADLMLPKNLKTEPKGSMEVDGNECQATKFTEGTDKEHTNVNPGVDAYLMLPKNLKNEPKGSIMEVDCKGCQTSKFTEGEECFHHFFMNLVPELDTLSVEQINLLKTKILKIVDELKNSRP